MDQQRLVDIVHEGECLKAITGIHIAGLLVDGQIDGPSRDQHMTGKKVLFPEVLAFQVQEALRDPGAWTALPGSTVNPAPVISSIFASRSSMV